MKSKLIIIDETSPVIDTNRGMIKQTKTYRLGDEKFQICYEHSNGSPLGFNTKKCLCQYSKNDGKWNYLEDISVLSESVRNVPSYFSSESKQHMELFFKEMESRLVKIYS